MNKSTVIKFDGDTLTDLPSTAKEPKVGDTVSVQLAEPPFTTRAGVVIAVRQDGSGWKYDVRVEN